MWTPYRYSDATWAPWPFKLLMTQHFIHQFVQAKNEKIWKLLIIDWWFPSQRASNEESISSSLRHHIITHWHRDKIAHTLPNDISTAFSWMKIYGSRLIFHWSLLLGIKLTTFQHHSADNDLAPTITRTNAYPVHWPIYVHRGRWVSNVKILNCVR